MGTDDICQLCLVCDISEQSSVAFFGSRDVYNVVTHRPQCVYKLSLIFSSLFGCFSVLWLVSILASVIILSHRALYGDKSSFFSVCPCFSI